MQSKAVFAGIILISEFVVSGGIIDKQEEADLAVPVATKAPYKYVKKPITADDGTFHGYLRMHHVFHGKDNGYDKVTGSTMGMGLGYGMEVVSNLKVGGEIYGSADTGLTDTDETAIAYGQFMNTVKSPKQLDAGYGWGVHLRYEVEAFKATLAKSQFKSPMTKIQITHVPNLYEYARVDGKVLGGNASLSYINKMSYGSRSAADWGAIGEFTGTAGMFMKPMDTDGPGLSPYLKRGHYYSIDKTLTAGTTDSNGILVFGYEKKIDKFNINVWDFLVDDVLNNIFAEGTYTFLLAKCIDTKISAHVWNQNISNANY